MQVRARRFERGALPCDSRRARPAARAAPGPCRAAPSCSWARRACRRPTARRRAPARRTQAAIEQMIGRRPRGPSSVLGSATNSVNVRGTCTFSTTTSWLPVPRSPPTCQVSRILQSPRLKKAEAHFRHRPARAMRGSPFVFDDAQEQDPLGQLAAGHDSPTARSRNNRRLSTTAPGPSGASSTRIATAGPRRFRRARRGRGTAPESTAASCSTRSKPTDASA